jgi:hypothetical protein
VDDSITKGMVAGVIAFSIKARVSDTDYLALALLNVIIFPNRNERGRSRFRLQYC